MLRRLGLTSKQCVKIINSPLHNKPSQIKYCDRFEPINYRGANYDMLE